MELIKKHRFLILLGIIAVAYDFFISEFFFVPLFIYYLVIRYFLSDSIGKKLRNALTVLVWSGFLVLTVLIYSANHYYPKGPMVGTGDVVCQNDDRGPCGEVMIEDTRNLDIPEWVKFFKSSKGELLLFGLLFASIVVRKNKD